MDTVSPLPPETFYLIDGYAEIFRAFYAIRRPLHSPVTGEPTNAVFVVARMLLKLFQLKPDYVVFVLDAPGATFRDELHRQYVPRAVAPAASAEADGVVDAVSSSPSSTGGGPESDAVASTEAVSGTPSAADGIPSTELPPPAALETPGYKGTRRATPDALSLQVPRILEMVRLFGIPVVAHPGVEADDVIATLARRIGAGSATGERARHTRIVSPDKDFEQLVTSAEHARVTLFDVRTGVETDTESVRERRGVLPEQIVDFLALTGDVVDNIPGVTGIGPRTAAKLLTRYGSVEGMRENLAEIEERWREPLGRALATQLPLSRRLITLKHDAPVMFDPEEARVVKNGAMLPYDASELGLFFDVLGFDRLKRDL